MDYSYFANGTVSVRCNQINLHRFSAKFELCGTEEKDEALFVGRMNLLLI